MDKRSEATRAQIISAATALFLEKGYTAATVRDICSASGVSLSRVNYHFVSKAALAGEICRELFRNFYTELKSVLKNSRSYSFVTEAVALRFLVEILLDDGNPASLFYRDVAREGIVADVFTSEDQNIFTSFAGTSGRFNIPELENRLPVYSHIFASSLSAISSGWDETLEKCGGDAAKAKKLMQDVFAGLFMQMMDMPHDAQKAMVDMSDAYFRLIDVRLTGLTNVSISMPLELSLREKVNIVAPAVERDAIKLKSSDDRQSIELDTDFIP